MTMPVKTKQEREREREQKREKRESHYIYQSCLVQGKSPLCYMIYEFFLLLGSVAFAFFFSSLFYSFKQTTLCQPDNLIVFSTLYRYTPSSNSYTILSRLYSFLFLLLKHVVSIYIRFFFVNFLCRRFFSKPRIINAIFTVLSRLC